MEEGLLSWEAATEKNIGEALDDLFGYSKGRCTGYYIWILAYTITDELIVLGSDTHILRTSDNKQRGHNTLDSDILPVPLNHSTDRTKDSDNDDSENDINNTSLYPTERQKSTSAHREPNRPYTSTLLPIYKEDIEGSKENADSSNSDKAGDKEYLSKRQKLSGSLGDKMTLSSYNRRAQNSRSAISEDTKDDDSESIAFDNNLTSTTRTVPDSSEFSSLAEPQLSLEVIDTDQE